MICIYHGDCADGFTAATILKHRYPEAKMIKGTHGSGFGPPKDLIDEDIFIVDFSYDRDTILYMASLAKAITILDHHKSAREELVDLPSNVKVVFDMERSGAGITWDYFHCMDDIPKFVQHVQDRDLWKFELDYTKEFSAGLFACEYDFDIYTSMIYEVDYTEDLIKDGFSIMRKQTKDINELIKSASYRMDICGFNVPVLNVPHMYASEAGSLMAVGQPFAATYYDTEKTRNFSLRSTDDGEDVSKIAVKMGGGGHRNASGYKVEI